VEEHLLPRKKAVLVMEERLGALEQLILAVVAAAVRVKHRVQIQAAQAAPALLSSSTPYHHKLYSCSKALHNGQCLLV
jgi:hypothetical protein